MPDFRTSTGNRYLLVLIIAFLGTTQIATLCVTASLWFRLNQTPELAPLVLTNGDDPFIAERVEQFALPTVLQQYDQVIWAIEQYQRDHDAYPSSLADLVPAYLAREPGIYIRNGEELAYSPQTKTWGLGEPDGAPFTFYIYGHYPFPANIHGWFLYFCPNEIDGCNRQGDRHRSWYRVNNRWVWINSSAL
jgi:hypothetical protein